MSLSIITEHKANYRNVIARNVELEGVNKQLLTGNTYMKVSHD